jgi:enoyl-CoA hydratase/carnithine racemase
MGSDSVLVKAEEGFTTITMNRPERRNALSLDLLREMTTAFGAAGESDARGVILAGNGPVFSSGHDYRDLAGADEESMRELLEACTELMLTMQAIPQPVVARVHALATAAGCQLVATCDLAVASTTAKFCTPGVQIGLFCSTPMVALSRNVARKHALEMLLTGNMMSAEDAYRMGLVNRVVEPGQAREEALKLARKIAATSAAAVKFGKEAFYRQLEMGVADAYDHATEVMVQNMMARDAEEGISAFVEKRAPTWEDR